jgi:RNA polymerase sigma factor (sigma-70 family)
MTKKAKHRSKHHDPIEEKNLIEASLRGEEAAFARLYHRYHGQVHAFCARLLRGKNEVEDAVQQVFLEAWRSLGRFEGRSLFSTWLTKIAIHTCLSFHRKSGRLVLSATDDMNQFEQAQEILWAQPQKIPDEEMFLGEKKAVVNKLLARMTPKKKLVFVMSDMHGMTAPEISTSLKIPDATVRTRLFHARREFSHWVEKNKTYRELLSNQTR